MNQPGDRPRRSIRRVLPWLPAIIPPLAIPAVYLAAAAGADRLVAKPTHAMLALVLLPMALAVCLLRLAIRRDRLHLVLIYEPVACAVH